MNRVLSAARLHMINPLVIVGVPWLVVTVSFAINLAVWSTIGLAEEAPDSFTGGVLALYFTVLVVYVQAVTQLLPFAMGVSLSRRTFYLGTAVVAVAQALLYGLALAVLTRIETATGGWGAGLEFWAPGALRVDNFAVQALASGAPMLAFMFVGIAIGVTQKRWGPTGVWGVLIGLVAFLGALVILISWLEGWGPIGRWFADQSPMTLTIGLPIVLAAVLAVVAYGGLRRIVP